MASYPRSSECGERFSCTIVRTFFHIYFIQTREASSSSSWLVSELMEWCLDALGALMGKGGCRDMVACRWYFNNIHFCPLSTLSQDWEITSGQAARLAGWMCSRSGKRADEYFQVLAMLGESLVPKPARHFFNVVSANFHPRKCFIFCS